ncbi:MAG: hypothetical protein M1503_00270 [Thaumarchaeota archaeon]|nr:hypothetical protein [Nitrososphaerota archaeon]MCL5316686.1 hypothetical protein [Nitrososphaerota archaeon]
MRKITAFLTIVSIIVCVFTAPVLAQTDEKLGTITVRKSVVKVTDDGWILTHLEVKNNGSVPIFKIEIYEYYNSAFTLGKNVTIEYNGTKRVQSIPAASGGQFILEIGEPSQLEPSKTVDIHYWSRSEKSGDFQIPTSIVWYSFSFKGNLLRQNMFSNGLLTHVKGQMEQTIDTILPYAVSIAAFTATLLVLDYMRRNLREPSQRIKEKRLFK